MREQDEKWKQKQNRTINTASEREREQKLIGKIEMEQHTQNTHTKKPNRNKHNKNMSERTVV